MGKKCSGVDKLTLQSCFRFSCVKLMRSFICIPGIISQESHISKDLPNSNFYQSLTPIRQVDIWTGTLSFFSHYHFAVDMTKSKLLYDISSANVLHQDIP